MPPLSAVEAVVSSVLLVSASFLALTTFYSGSGHMGPGGFVALFLYAFVVDANIALVLF